MGILLWILFGLIAGVIAKAVSPNDKGLGWLATIGVGIAGSFVGNLILLLFTGDKSEGFTVGHLLVSVLGALIVLFIVDKAFNRNRV